MKRVLTGVTIAFALAVLVLAQADMTGKWQGETKSGSRVVLDLKATETTLTGTLTTEGHTYPIADGKVNKNTFTFKATVNDQTEAFTGELGGDQITIRMDRRSSNPAVLTRVKPAAMTGTWQGETVSGSQIVLDLTASETALIGTLTRNGQPVRLSDGKWAKNTFTFKATIGDQPEAFTGELEGDQMTIWLDRQGRDRAAILKRVTK
jgi:hypothetical protein